MLFNVGRCIKPETIEAAHCLRSRANGNPTTAYAHDAGDYVVRDDVTGNLVQISDRSDPNRVPDSSITGPYEGSWRGTLAGDC